MEGPAAEEAEARLDELERGRRREPPLQERAAVYGSTRDEPERHFEGALIIRVTEQGTGQLVAGALVQPGMDVDGTGVIAIPLLTSATAESVVPYPVGRATRMSVSVEKEGYGSYWTSVALEPGPTTRLEVELKPL